VKLLTEPLVTLTSEATKPVTISEKTTFTANGALVGVGAVVENWVTVGAVPPTTLPVTAVWPATR